MRPFLPSVMPFWDGFVSLFFPKTCVACGQESPAADSCFCLPCRLKLRPTGQHLQPDNAFTRRFWGQIPIEAGAAMFHFSKNSPVQRALHQLKYRNRADAGTRIGREFGRLLRHSELFAPIELIVPVPLHPQKERRRGYNQSEKFADGLGETLHKPVDNQSLVRRVLSESQTRKQRSERFQNVESAFAVKNPSALAGKNILLVDDVLTTGATLESCGRQLLALPGTRLFLATIAIAEHD